jgi:hypothetical protein
MNEDVHFDPIVTWRELARQSRNNVPLWVFLAEPSRVARRGGRCRSVSDNVDYCVCMPRTFHGLMR